MITSEPSVSFIIAVVGYRFEPEVSHLQSLKVGVWNKFLTPTNSHLIQFPITASIKSVEFYGILERHYQIVGGGKIKHSIYNFGFREGWMKNPP